MILDEKTMRIKHVRCPKCGSEHIEIIWRCEEPGIVSYECLDCKQVTKKSMR